MVHGLEAQYFGKIKFTYLEISDPQNSDFLQSLGFQIRPSFYLLDGEGNILHQWVGFQTQDQFEQIFAQYVQ